MNRAKKRPLSDPRRRPGNLPEGTQFIRGRDNPGYGFSPAVESKSDTKPEVVLN